MQTYWQLMRGSQLTGCFADHFWALPDGRTQLMLVWVDHDVTAGCCRCRVLQRAGHSCASLPGLLANGCGCQSLGAAIILWKTSRAAWTSHALSCRTSMCSRPPHGERFPPLTMRSRCTSKVLAQRMLTYWRIPWWPSASCRFPQSAM